MSIRLDGNDLPKTRVETSCGWWGHEWPHQTTTWPAIRIARERSVVLLAVCLDLAGFKSSASRYVNLSLSDLLSNN